MNQPSLPNSNLAVISLIMGILSWLAIPLIGAVAAIVCGHMAHREIRNAGGTLGGDGMATVGLVLGYVQIILSLVTALIIVVAILFFGFALSTFAH